jgi:hypothetical protein
VHRAAHENRGAFQRRQGQLFIQSVVYCHTILTVLSGNTSFCFLCAFTVYFEFFLFSFNFHVTLWQMFHHQQKILWERLVKNIYILCIMYYYIPIIVLSVYYTLINIVFFVFYSSLFHQLNAL